jgi:hypothetical protein
MPYEMPFHYKGINSTWQLFLSTYLMEHFADTLLNAAPYQYYMGWNDMNDTMLEFTTTNLDAFFPQLQLHYGFNKPVDLNFQILSAKNFRSKKQTRTLSFNLDMACQALLHKDDGTFEQIGLLEWYNGTAEIHIYSEGMLFNGTVSRLEFNDTYSTTDYYPTYRQSNFTINIALYGLASTIEYYLYKGEIAVPSQWGYFNMQDLFLDYFDNYIGFGITPIFKKYNASDFQNTTQSNNNVTDNITSLLMSPGELNCQQREFVRRFEAYEAMRLSGMA